MTTVIVRTKEELKAALNSNVIEIQIDNPELVKQLKSLRQLRLAGPLAIGSVIAAIPLMPVTGGASLPAAMVGFLGTSAFVVASGISALCIAIGGIVVIGILTDWEEVELIGVFKLKRKRK